jgi:hypothetical protein
MTLVSIDSQRRLYLPKELNIQAQKAIIIHREPSYILIPIPTEIIPIDTEKTIKELKQTAIEKAKKETKNANRV